MSINTHVAPHSGLDKFVFGNIDKSKTNHYAAHLILVWLFTSEFILVYPQSMRLTLPKFGFGTTSTWKWNISYESANNISVLLRHVLSTQATTVLVTGIPAKYCDEEEL
jgi:hypothetical protein